MKLVCISDTHTHEPELPDGDILIHSGDMTIHGYRIEVYRQLCWLESVRHRYKHVLLSPGNHDLYFERDIETARAECEIIGVTLLHNQLLEVEGLKFWGSAHTPDYHGWAFMLNQNQINHAWRKIPQVDVLITHGPPYGILDKSYRGDHIGCPKLLEAVKRIQPKVHAFGHAHEGHGLFHDGVTQFVNAAQKPLVVDLS